MIRRILAPVLARLGSRTILAVGGTLFLLNMVIPDPLPLLDELLILAGTVLLSRFAKTGSMGAEAAAGPMSPDRTSSAPKHVGRSSTQHH